MAMRRSLLQFACAAALGGFVFGAQAAQYGSPGGTSIPSQSITTPTTKAASNASESRDAAEMERCNQFKGAVRADCLARAKTNTDHAVSEIPAGVAAGTGQATFGGSTGPVPANKNK